MIPDPPVRADGKCVVCGRGRKIKRSGKYGLDKNGRRVAATDPFCSTQCCREYHGTSLPDHRRTGRPKVLA